ncbi:MAG: hypothetical protein Q9220_001546 [cf. Caloplaca sp. 1 TL-2023]
MDRLPPELVHSILSVLRPEDLLNLRLTCKTFAELSAKYLLRECELMFTLNSFQRLSKISQHPLYSQHVRSLVYYADTLKRHHDKDEWYRALRAQLWMNRYENPSLAPLPSRNASEREWRTYRRNIKRSTRPEQQFSKQQLREAWKKRHAMWQDQQRLRDMHFGEDMIKAAIAQLPNLKHISLSNYHDIKFESDAVERLYKPTLEDVMGDGGHDHISGIPQFFSLLRGVQQAEISLESLIVGSISWLVFTCHCKNWELMKSVFRPLRRFNFSVHISQEVGWHDPDENVDDVMSDDDEECEELLREDRVADLMSLMTDVRAFNLCFYSDALRPVPFVPTYKILTYPHLTEISFNNHYGDADDLLEFFKRHAQKLRNVRISNFTLLSGSWLDIFCEFRDMLRLDHATFRGWLHNKADKDDDWDTANFHDEGDLRRSMAQFILGDPKAPSQDVLLEKRKEVNRRRKLSMEEHESNGLYSW